MKKKVITPKIWPLINLVLAGIFIDQSIMIALGLFKGSLVISLLLVVVNLTTGTVVFLGYMDKGTKP